MSSVFSMDADGISKFWKMKVSAKSPRTSTLQIEAMNSKGVSSWWVCFFFRLLRFQDLFHISQSCGCYHTMRNIRSQRAKSTTLLTGSLSCPSLSPGRSGTSVVEGLRMEK